MFEPLAAFFIMKFSCGVFGKDLPSARFCTVANRLVEALNRGDYGRVRSEFSPSLLEALPLEKTVQDFQGILERCGKIIRLGAPALISNGLAVFAVRCERGEQELRLELDREDKINELSLAPPAARNRAPV